MPKYTLVNTVDLLIQELEGDLESLSWEIREETNFEDNETMVGILSADWMEKRMHLDNLIVIRDILVSNNLSTWASLENS